MSGRDDDRLRQLGREGLASAARVESVVCQARGLSEDEFVLAWAQLTQRADEIARKRERYARKPAAVADTETKPRRAGRPPKASQQAEAPSFTEKALKALTQHPEGLLASEVGRAIGQRTENAHGTLKLLEGQGRAHPYRMGSRVLWGLPDVEPKPRTDTTTAMVRAALQSRPGLSIRELRDAVVAERKAQDLPPLRPKSIETQISRMSNLGQIRQSGANHLGPTYELPGDATEGGHRTSLN